jgi:predicted SAM-dependent methyltransferase
MKLKKLHLGCGTKHLEGYTNIDIRYLPGVDEINNIRFLRNYKNNTVDEIYACHVLEHFSRWEYKDVLKRWFEILKPGGQLRLAVPDFSSICSYYIKTGDLKSLIGLMYGGQDYDENYHYVTFDYDTLSNDLKEIGYSTTTEWDTEKYDSDDFSKAYLPHMDKENGILMSLNILAVK